MERFLMYRVELKEGCYSPLTFACLWFLMYRVELKGNIGSNIGNGIISAVPNVPCGVERHVHLLAKFPFIEVPNVPCGVERANSTRGSYTLLLVPNVPCGVESNFFTSRKASGRLFLMYRVELKE